eukprot:163574-Prymnesium_polylepis.1
MQHAAEMPLLRRYFVTDERYTQAAGQLTHATIAPRVEVDLIERPLDRRLARSRIDSLLVTPDLLRPVL